MSQQPSLEATSGISASMPAAMHAQTAHQATASAMTSNEMTFVPIKFRNDINDQSDMTEADQARTIHENEVNTETAIGIDSVMPETVEVVIL